MTVSTAWEGRAVRASDVPAGGLDKARLRFELLAPGNLWIDDLHVPSETTSRSGTGERPPNVARGHSSLSRRALCRIRPARELALDQESSAAATTRLARAPERSVAVGRRTRAPERRRTFCPIAGSQAQVESRSE